jgi:hypothetical protein
MRGALIGLSALLATLPATTGCSLGQGTGDVSSDALFAHACWGEPPASATAPAVGAPYDMLPDFFAAVPYRKTLQIRVQRGTDLTEVSDGLEVLIDDVDAIRATIPRDDADGGVANPTEFRVAVPPGVYPPGSPTVPPPDVVANPPLVHMSLYLQRSCHNQNVILYSVDGKITFTALFDADPNETSAQEKLTTAAFDVQFGDLHDVPLGDYPRDVPAGLQSRVTGHFSFYFERGQPGQPFP